MRALRSGYGLSQAQLAERATVARSTIGRLEADAIRPRWSLLYVISRALDPDYAPEILDRLLSAAGAGLAIETERWAQRRLRRLDEATLAGVSPRPVRVERSVRLHAAANNMDEIATGLLELSVHAGARLTAQQSGRLCDLAGQLRVEAGRLERSAGLRIEGLSPARRRRGDPPDTAVTPSAPVSVRSLRRWLAAWQVREGRRDPRTARQRAIAETGQRERAKIRATADLRPGMRHIVEVGDGGAVPRTNREIWGY